MSDDSSQSEQTSVRAAVMEQARAVGGDQPAPRLRSLICPYCGSVTPDSGRCGGCGGRFDPLSRQATQNQMGPWMIRDEKQPFRPGCGYETLVRLIEQDKISPETVLRGPSTRQFWMLARHTPGVGHRLGMCHSCQANVKPDAFACPNCHAPFSVERDRQHLGLGPVRPLPGQGVPSVLAMRAEPASVPLGGAASAAPGSRDPLSGAEGTREDAAAIGPQFQRRIDEANRLARRWRAESQTSRRNAWIAIGLASVITLAALVYAVSAGGQNVEAPTARSGGSGTGAGDE